MYNGSMRLHEGVLDTCTYTPESTSSIFSAILDLPELGRDSSTSVSQLGGLCHHQSIIAEHIVGKSEEVPGTSDLASILQDVTRNV